jgi:hypothetical protein
VAWKSAGSLRLIFTTAVTFGVLHALYGCGSLLGIGGWVASHRSIRGVWQRLSSWVTAAASTRFSL